MGYTVTNLESLRWTYEENYHGEDLSDYYVAYAARVDGSLVRRANLLAFKSLLQGHTRTGYIHHWAGGSIEYLLVHEDAPEDVLQALQDAHDDLRAYPVLDDVLWADMEADAIGELWDDMPLHERVDICRDAGDSVFAARHDYPPYGARETLSVWVNE